MPLGLSIADDVPFTWWRSTCEDNDAVPDSPLTTSFSDDDLIFDPASQLTVDHLSLRYLNARLSHAGLLPVSGSLYSSLDVMPY